MMKSIQFSTRTNWHREPNRLSLRLEEIRKTGRDVIDLTLSNPTEAGIEYPAQILSALARHGSLQYSPDPKGLPSARQAIAEYYESRRISVALESIVLTASTSESYSHLFRLLCEPRDAILIPAPSYPLFEFLGRVNDVATNCYDLRYDGAWHIDLSSLRSSITKQTRAIVVVSPNNPTGSFLKKGEHKEIISMAEESGCSLIVDEVFADYGFEADSDRVISTAGHANGLTFTLNGISKMAGLPQMKLGWIVVSGEDEQKKEALARLEILADTFLSVNTPIQVALPEVMKLGAGVRESIRARVKQNYQFLQSSLGQTSACSLLNSEGGWNAIVRVPNTRSDEAWALDLLNEASVYVHPGYFFDLTHAPFLVLSLLPDQKTFKRGLTLMLEYVAAVHS